ASAAALRLHPTGRDAALMSMGTVDLGLTGGLFAAGAFHQAFFTSTESRGGVVAGLGAGYLLSTAVSAFSEPDPARVATASVGMLAGDLTGLGLHMAVQGFSRDNVAGAMFSEGEVNARALSAGIGGVLLGGAAYAYQPYLRPGPNVASMTLTGMALGAGSWGLALKAGDTGQPIGDIARARLTGGLLTGGTLGAISGVVLSRWFTAEATDDVAVVGGT